MLSPITIDSLGVPAGYAADYRAEIASMYRRHRAYLTPNRAAWEVHDFYAACVADTVVSGGGKANEHTLFQFLVAREYLEASRRLMERQAAHRQLVTA
jgi:hypothetical protein